MNSPVGVLGAGSWGTALAMMIARKGQPVWLWRHHSHAIKKMQTAHCNPDYLPDYPFPANLQVSDNLNEVIAQVKKILIVVPSHAFRETILRLKPLLQPQHQLSWGTKGLDPDSGSLLYEVVEELCGHRWPCAVIAGPSFAQEVAAGLPTALTVAATDIHYATELCECLNSDTTRVYTSTDMIGVQLAGAVKNVLAIATGISDGIGFGANARSALITRGLVEMTRLGLAMGAMPTTFMGLAGVGDLVLTCTDNQSRNRRFGLALGKGQTQQEALKKIGQVVEGMKMTQLVHQLAQKYQIEMPITEQVYLLLKQLQTPKQAVENLFSRACKQEGI